LLIGNLVGNKVGCVGIHQHVLGVSPLCLNSCALQIGTKHSAATLAPFAAPASGLNPGGTHAVADLSRGDVGSHGDNLADRLVAEDSGEWSGQVSERLMDVGVADAACMHLHEHLIGSGLRLRDFFDLPRTAHSGNERGLHNTSSYPNSMRARLGRCMILDARFVNHTPKPSLTVSWGIVGN